MDHRLKSGSWDTRRLPLLVFAFSFLFFAFVMWCAPYSSDDLEFASLNYSSAGEYLRYALEYGNGRLLGNLLAIALSHSRVLCILVKGLMLSSALVLIPAVLNLRSTWGYLLSFVLFVMIEPAVFGEVYVWTSGFSNYFPPVWMTLVTVWLIRGYPGTGSPLKKISVCLGILLLGAAGQLFIEHSSGVNLLLAACFTAYSLRRDRKALAPCLVWLAAAAAGLAAMLLIPKLFYIAGNHTESYRSIHLGGLNALLLSCAKNAVQLCGHYFGACLLPVCGGAVITVYLTRSRRSEKANRILYVLSVLSTLYLLVCFSLSSVDYLGKSALIQHAVDCVFTVLPFAVWVLASFRLEPEARNPILFCLAFALISLAPLLAVTPIPTRVIFQSYGFVLAAALLCFAQFRPLLDQKLARYGKTAAVTVCLLLVLVIGSIFLSVYSMVQVRDRHIRQELENGATEITIFQLPYEYTTWDHLWSQKYSYGTDRDITFQSMDFAEWMNDIYK